MHSRIVIAYFTLVFISGCLDRKPIEEPPLPEIVLREVVLTHDNCDSDSISCTHVQIAYPEFTDTLKTHFNQIIAQKLKTISSQYFSEEVIERPLEQIAHSFIDDYKAFVKDFNDYQMGWYVKVFVEITYETDQVLSFRIDSESFTGGAHPNSSTSLFVIDKKTYKELSTADIISDTTKFKELLEKEFRKSKEMTGDQSFADRGFYINDGDFLLNDNIGLTEHEVIVHFDPYEIAPYSEGATTLELSKDLIQDFLKID